MVIVAVFTTMSIHNGTDIVESFMASTIENFTNISKMSRRRYRTIIPSTTRKFKRLGDKSSIPGGVQNTQSPQDLPLSKPPRSNTTPVHLRNLEDFEKAVMEFMQEPLVSLATPPRRRCPLKCIQEKGDAEYSVPNPGLHDRLHVNGEDNVVPKQIFPFRDQTVPSTDSEADQLLERTLGCPDTSERITSDFFDRDFDKNVQATRTLREKPGWISPLRIIAPKVST